MHLPVLYELSLLSRNLRRTHSGFCDDVTADGCLPPCVSPSPSPSLPRPALSLIAEMDSQLLTISVLRLCERIVNGSWLRLSKPIPENDAELFGRDRAQCYNLYNFTSKLSFVDAKTKTKYSMFYSLRLLTSVFLITIL